MKAKKKRSYTFWWFLFLVVNLLIVAGIAWREFHGKGQGEGFSLGEGGIWFLLLGIFCVAVMLGTETVKCFLTLRFLGEPISVKGAFETVALGKYYDALMPTGGGGQPFQIYWLSRSGFSAGACTAMPASYFVTRQLAAMFLTILTFFLYPDPGSSTIRYAAYLGLACCAIVPCTEIAFSFQPKATTKVVELLLKTGARLHVIRDYEGARNKVLGALTQFHEGFSLIAGEKGLLAALLLLSLLCRAALCSLPFIVLRALGSPVSFLPTFFLTIYIYSAVTLIPTPGNSGVSEGAFYLIFSENGSSEVFWAMLLWRGLCYYSFLLLGLVIFGRHTLSHSEQAVAGAGPEAGQEGGQIDG